MTLDKQKRFYKRLLTEELSNTVKRLPKILYRGMSLDELSMMYIYKAFRELISVEEDSGGKFDTYKGNNGKEYYFFKSFTSKITNNFFDFINEADGFLVVYFDSKVLANITDTELTPYQYDKSYGAINEYEYRLFSNFSTVRFPKDFGNLVKRIDVYNIPRDYFMEEIGEDIKNYFEEIVIKFKTI